MNDEPLLRVAGLGLLALSAVAFVVLAHVVQGLLELLSRLADPTTLGLLVLAVSTGLLARTLWGGAAARAGGAAGGGAGLHSGGERRRRSRLAAVRQGPRRWVRGAVG